MICTQINHSWITHTCVWPYFPREGIKPIACTIFVWHGLICLYTFWQKWTWYGNPADHDIEENKENDAHALPITDTDMQPLVANIELALAV